MVWHLQALAEAGVGEVVINTAWLGEQIEAHCGTAFGTHHSRRGNHRIEIAYSREGRDFGGALETAGGIARALPLVESDVFWLAAGDVYVPDFVFDAKAVQAFKASRQLAHLWLVPNPEHHPRGDFGMSPEGLALNLPADDPALRYTYSTIALLHAELFFTPWCDIPVGNPGGEEGGSGAAAAPGHGRGPRGRLALQRPLDRRGYPRASGRTQPLNQRAHCPGLGVPAWAGCTVMAGPFSQATQQPFAGPKARVRPSGAGLPTSACTS